MFKTWISMDIWRYLKNVRFASAMNPNHVFHICFLPTLNQRHHVASQWNSYPQGPSAASMLRWARPARRASRGIDWSTSGGPIITLPETNIHSTWKWMVGIRLFPFGMDHFRGRTVSFRECTNLNVMFYIAVYFEFHHVWCNFGHQVILDAWHTGGVYGWPNFEI